MPWHTAIDAIRFAERYDDSSITLGGGEPTLHPDFFKILKLSMETFEHVWFATNGTNTKAMKRIIKVIFDEDYYDPDAECSCSEDDRYDCECHYRADGISNPNGKLYVAMSQDWAHESQTVQPDPAIAKFWETKSYERYGHFEIRNVFNTSDGPSAHGRAKRTGVGYAERCICPDIMIKPDGSLRLCGCSRQPVAGDVWSGFNSKAKKKLDSRMFYNSRCYFNR